GRGAPHLILHNSGVRGVFDREPSNDVEPSTTARTPTLHMNGKEIVDFAISEVPRVLFQVLTKAHLKLDQVDLFVFHQANEYLLQELRKSIGIPFEKFQI